MPRSPEEQSEWEQQCYGCTQAEAKHGIDELVKFNNAGRPGPANMSLGSILSDAQEIIAILTDLAHTGVEERDDAMSKHSEKARQYLNRVKFAIFSASPIYLWQRCDVDGAAEVASWISDSGLDEPGHRVARSFGFDI